MRHKIRKTILTFRVRSLRVLRHINRLTATCTLPHMVNTLHSMVNRRIPPMVSHSMVNLHIRHTVNRRIKTGIRTLILILPHTLTLMVTLQG